MRRRLFLTLILFCLFFAFACAPVWAQKEAGPAITSITVSQTAEDVEEVAIDLSQKVDPRVFMLTGENPRLVLDFAQTTSTNGSTITQGEPRLVQAVRTGIHTGSKPKTRVVIDLNKEARIEYRLEASQDGRQVKLVLLAAADSPAKAAKIKGGKEIKQVAAEKKKTKKNVSVEAVPSLKQLLKITFDESSNRGEMVLFHLNDFYPPQVSAVEKDTPRVICDFRDMGRGPELENELSFAGKYIQSVQLEDGEEKGDLRVVLDLFPNRDYDLQQVFFKNDNLFVLIVNELTEEKGKGLE